MTEQELAMYWKSGAARGRKLRDRDGRGLMRMPAGLVAAGGGPDFQGAMILRQGRLERGDVELHVASSMWRGHRHHLDPRFNSVILQSCCAMREARGR